MCEIPGRNASTKQSCGTTAEPYKRLELSVRNISMRGAVPLPTLVQQRFTSPGWFTGDGEEDSKLGLM